MAPHQKMASAAKWRRRKEKSAAHHREKSISNNQASIAAGREENISEKSAEISIITSIEIGVSYRHQSRRKIRHRGVSRKMAYRQMAKYFYPRRPKWRHRRHPASSVARHIKKKKAYTMKNQRKNGGVIEKATINLKEM